MHRETALTILLALTAAPLRAQEGAPTPRELFVKHCAQCHGENGDGNGVQRLEKPARSFKDGGFSYGNTPEALLRTITFGIPGTPMPSFSSALTDAQKKELAAYVITLGPEVVEVKASETRLVVKDVPLFVRGKLPPIVEGAKETVRGLLVGTPDGFTFEYDVEDVRLLGVRQGDFVERRDWGGRGGDALQPLGKVVVSCGSPPGRPVFLWSPPVKGTVTGDWARARLSGTRVDGGVPRVLYHIEQVLGTSAQGAGTTPTRLVLSEDAEEAVRTVTCSVGTGFRRELSLRAREGGPSDNGELRWSVFSAQRLVVLANEGRWAVIRSDDVPCTLVALARGSAGNIGIGSDFVLVYQLPLERGKPLEVKVDTYALSSWTPEVRDAWLKELGR